MKDERELEEFGKDERELEEFGAAMTRLEPPRAREAFRPQLRAQLVVTAATEWSRRRARPSLFPLLFAPRLAPVVAVLVIAMLVGGSGVVAAASLAGDPAYPLKTAFEQVELALARDDAARAEVLTRHADRRLEELRRSSDSRPEAAPTATDAYQAKVQELRAAIDALKSVEGSRSDAALDVAAAAAAKHVAVLEELKRRHDAPGLERAIERALEDARELQERAKGKRDRKRGDKGDRDEDRAPGAAPAASPTRSPRATGTLPEQQRATSRPGETPRPTETREPDETPEPRETPKTATPRPTERP